LAKQGFYLPGLYGKKSSPATSLPDEALPSVAVLADDMETSEPYEHIGLDNRMVLESGQQSKDVVQLVLVEILP
jgi:hypothetical protein